MTQSLFRIVAAAFIAVVADAQCPAGWTDTGTYCYGSVPASSWTTAESLCTQYHPQSHLTPLNTVTEIELVLANCAYTNGEDTHWVGIKDSLQGWSWATPNYVTSVFSLPQYWYLNQPPVSTYSSSGSCIYVNNGILDVANCAESHQGCCRVKKSVYASRTPTATRSASATQTRTRSASVTPTRTRSVSATQTITKTPTATQTRTRSASATSTKTASETPTASQTSSATPSISTSPAPQILADSVRDIALQQQTNGWSWGYYNGSSVREELTTFGTIYPVRQAGWSVPRSYLKLGGSYITTNTATYCHFASAGSLVPSIMWTNDNKWPTQGYGIYLELYHENVCGDGVTVEFKIDNARAYYNTSADRDELQLAEYYTRQTISSVELIVNGNNDCTCDAVEYRLQIIPSYDGVISQKPQPSLSPSPYPEILITDDDDGGNIIISESPSSSASPSASPSSSPSATSSVSGSNLSSASAIYKSTRPATSPTATSSATSLTATSLTATSKSPETSPAISLTATSTSPTGTISSSQTLSQTPNNNQTIHYLESDSAILYTSIASAATYVYLALILAVCFVGNALDSTGSRDFISALEYNPEISFIKSRLNGKILKVNTGWFSSWYCSLRQLVLPIPTTLIHLLRNHRLISWLTHFDYTSPRLHRAIVVGIMILTNTYFTSLAVTTELSLRKGAGWGIAVINATVYFLLTPIVAACMGFIGRLETAWKYPELTRELLQRAEFEHSLTSVTIKKILDKMIENDGENLGDIVYKIPIDVCALHSQLAAILDVDTLTDNIRDYTKIVNKRPSKPLPPQIITNKILASLIPLRDWRSLAAFSCIGAWFGWCASQLWSTPDADFVVQSTGWCYIIVTLLVEPLHVLIASKLPTFRRETNLERKIREISNNCSILLDRRKIMFNMNYKLLFKVVDNNYNSAITTLYYLNRAMENNEQNRVNESIKVEHLGHIIDNKEASQIEIQEYY